MAIELYPTIIDFGPDRFVCRAVWDFTGIDRMNCRVATAQESRTLRARGLTDYFSPFLVRDECHGMNMKQLIAYKMSLFLDCAKKELLRRGWPDRRLDCPEPTRIPEGLGELWGVYVDISHG